MTSRPRRKRHSSVEPADLRAERDVLMRSLERERNTLQEAAKQTEARYRSLEQELTDLASLYVASFQLAGTLSLRRVVKHLCELLEQLVGARSFAVYVLTPDGKRAQPIAARGDTDGKRSLPSTGERFGDACLTGMPRVVDDPHSRVDGEPIAVLPLSFEGEVIGAITIDELLPHKTSWQLIDHELFKLVCAHGAAALIASNLYAGEAGPRAALRTVHENLSRLAGSGQPSAEESD
jgi:transcriptional regulator with GAF, ATPase, and Fis domain